MAALHHGVFVAAALAAVISIALASFPYGFERSRSDLPLTLPDTMPPVPPALPREQWPDEFADLVLTKQGPVRGVVHNGGKAFFGIFYAESTAGPKRWTAPVPKRSWAPNVYDATSWAAQCPQRCVLPESLCPAKTDEDCLNLNVWSPPDADANSALPVMVFIHGGAYEQGGAGTDMYQAQHIAERGGVVVVSFNYRLGALGFLVAHSGGVNGNFGLLDQRLALKWVQENIASFGGDPHRVTVFGESAGAHSIGAHMVSPGSQGLFHAAIIGSNPWTLPMKDKSTGETTNKAFAKELRCKTSDIACYRAAPVEAVIAAQVKAGRHLFLWNVLATFMPWTPAIDGKELSAAPLALFKAGKAAKIPVVLGSLKEEGVMFVYQMFDGSLSGVKYSGLLAGIYHLDSARILAKYPPQSGDNRLQFSQVVTDHLFACSARFGAEQISKTLGQPVYAYEWEHALSFDGWGKRYQFCVGRTCHGADLPFWFDTPRDLGKTETQGEVEMSHAFIGFISNFAHTHNPNQAGAGRVNLAAGVTPWPRFDPSNQHLLLVNDQGGADIHDFRKKQCDMWDHVGYY